MAKWFLLMSRRGERGWSRRGNRSLDGGDRVLVFCFILCATAVVATYESEGTARDAALFAVLPGALVVGVAMVWLDGPTRLRQLALIIGLMGAAVGAAVELSFSVPNPFVAHMLLVVLVALFMSKRAAWVVWGVGIVVWISVGIYFVDGGALPDPSVVDPRTPRNWMRIVTIYGVISAVALASIAYLVDRLVNEFRRSESLHAALAKESGERIAALEEQRALESHVRETQKLEALGTLAGGVAHDFNNLLMVILSSAELAAEEDDDPKAVREHLNQIVGAAKRASEVTNRLRVFGRGEATEVVPVRVDEHVRSVVGMLRRLIPTTHDIEVRIETEDDRVLAGVGLDQVLMNLCINAAEAMADHGRLEVAAARSERAAPGDDRMQKWIVLSVRDDGRGMDEATKRRIFEPFFSTKAAQGGSGLGMSVVHGIVEQANGFVEIDSAVDVGTTIRVFWPLYEGGFTPIDEIVAALAPAEEYTVLLVDDDEYVRKVIARRLEFAGYVVVEAANGEAALEVFRAAANEIDLVLSDAVMPRMGGYELHARLVEEFGEIPFVLCSGYAADTVPADFFEGPCRAFVEKPLEAPKLLERLRTMLESDEIRRPPWRAS